MTNGPLVCIIGGGAVGSLLAALLSRAGGPVELVVRPRSLGVFSPGIKVVTGTERFVAAVPARTEPSLDAALIVVAVKLPDLDSACAIVAAHLRKLDSSGQTGVSARPSVLLLQNGLDAADRASRVLPEATLLSGVVELGATSLAPGEVTYAIPGHLVIGAPSGGRTSSARMAAELLRPAAPVRISGDIRSAQRLKLLVNLNNGATAATGLTVQQLYARPAGIQLSLQLMREGRTAFDAAGLSLGSSPRSLLLRSLLRLPSPIAMAAFRQAGRRLARRFPVYGSTLQSLLRGRGTEIQDLNGAIDRLGRESGVATPANHLVTTTVNSIELAVLAGLPPPFVTPERLLAGGDAGGTPATGARSVIASGTPR